MAEFITALAKFEFLRNALIVGLLASLSCGIVGSYVVTRRISYVAGGISHFVLGGMGLARYLSVVYHWEIMTPLFGAVISALFAAIVIGLVSLKAKQREDTVIGALWAIGMAVGIIFISKTPGYNQDLMSYLFGNILMVSSGDIYLILILDIVVIAIAMLFYNQLLAVCFDEEFARLRGVNVEFFYLLLLCLTALTVVLLVTVVGIVMVIALLTLPSAVAGYFSRTLRQMMVLSIILCAVFNTLGLAISYAPNLPSGATIIVLAGATYLAVTVGSRVLKYKKAPVR
jgi:zinc transport system permease protein